MLKKGFILKNKIKVSIKNEFVQICKIGCYFIFSKQIKLLAIHTNNMVKTRNSLELQDNVFNKLLI